MKPSILIMNFTHVYEEERFLQNKSFEWIDCSEIPGTNCICDAEAEKALKKKISAYSPRGIHFIDSGNYHYVSKLWTDKIKGPFSLIVFDHHTDMQPGAFSNLLSCGSWVREVLNTNPFVRKVFIIGASEELIKSVDPRYSDRLVFYSDQALNHEEEWKKIAQEHVKEPVYLSIDKDVLNKEVSNTNWDQGSLSLTELEKLLSIILKKEQVIGADICGECAAAFGLLEFQKFQEQNNRVNKELAELIVATPL